MSIERISLLGVPVDICSPENLENEILELLAKPGTKQIVFLSIWNLLKVRHKGDYADCIKNADLILPISKSILGGAKFLKLNILISSHFIFLVQVKKLYQKLNIIFAIHLRTFAF